MIETTVLNYLKEALTVPVRMEVPEDPPNRYVVLEKTGSSRTNRLNTATIAAQSYAESLVEAAKLNEEVKAAIDNMIELNTISAAFNETFVCNGQIGASPHLHCLIQREQTDKTEKQANRSLSRSFICVDGLNNTEGC